jgi:PAS domain-containing protein
MLADPERVDLDAAMAQFHRAVQGTPQRFDWWARRKDGSTFPKEVVIQRSTYFGQDVVIAVARDISERVEAEETLRLQKTLLEAQSEASIDGILVVRDDGKILSYNQRFVDLWKIPPEVVAARTDEAALQAVLDQLHDPEAFLERVDHLYRNPHVRARDEIVLHDGRVFDRYSAPVISSEGNYYGRIWFFRDMTTQKRHAEELEQARQEAEDAREEASRYARSLEHSLEELRAAQARLVQQEKLASLGSLTAGIAHEIKNPTPYHRDHSVFGPSGACRITPYILY